MGEEAVGVIHYGKADVYNFRRASSGVRIKKEYLLLFVAGAHTGIRSGADSQCEKWFVPKLLPVSRCPGRLYY
jgi:hypothetical protein